MESKTEERLASVVTRAAKRKAELARSVLEASETDTKPPIPLTDSSTTLQGDKGRRREH